MPDPSISRRTVVGAAWMIAWRFGTRLAGLISTLILARILVPQDFGLLTMATTFAAMIDSLSQVQVQDALIRRGDDGRSLYDTAFTLQVIRALATALVIACAAPAAAAWFNEPRLVDALLFLSVFAAISGFENIGVVEFRRDLRYHMQFVLLAVPRLVQVAATIPLAFTLRSYWALLIGIAITRVTRVAVTYAAHVHRPRLTLRDAHELLGFSLWAWASSLAVMVWARCDAFILGGMLGAENLGLYLIAADIAIMPISELVAPASEVLYAGLAAVQKKGGNPAARAIPVALMLTLGILPLVVGISATSGYVVAALLGARWTAAQPLIAMLCWACVFGSFSYVLSSVLVVRGQIHRNFYAMAFSAMFRVVATWLAALTGDLRLVAAVCVGTVAVEALSLLVQLRLSGGGRFGAARGALLRLASSAVLSVVVLSPANFLWRDVPYSGGTALLYGLPLGALCMALTAAISALLWLISGRPDGPERQILALARQMLQPRRAYAAATGMDRP